MKNFVHVRSHPEGNIAEGYVFDETISFCSTYVNDYETRVSKVTSNIDGSNDSSSTNGNKYLRIIGRPMSARFEVDELDLDSWTEAEKYVLFKFPSISYYVQKHKLVLSEDKRRSMREVEIDHDSNFHNWFVDYVHGQVAKGVEVSAEVLLLAQKPYMMVKKYKSYSINGSIFHTSSYAHGKTSQSNGVKCTSNKSTYYGRILDIVELNYSNEGSIVLFKCEWVLPSGIRDANFGISQVNFNQSELSTLPFILASEATQVYYVQDPIEVDWHFVVTPSMKDMEPISSSCMYQEVIHVCMHSVIVHKLVSYLKIFNCRK